MNVSAGCSVISTTPPQATCSASGLTEIDLLLGDGNDNETVAPIAGSPPPSVHASGEDGVDTLAGGPGQDVLDGGPGADTITSRDGDADTITCGADADPTVVVDPVDAVDASCESVDDGEPPDTTLTSTPDTPTNARQFSFGYTSPDQGAAFRCWFDAQAPGACPTWPLSTDGLEGAHTFHVAAVDHGGRGLADPTPASFDFAVDRTAPDTTITSGPPATSDDSTPTFAFSSNDSGAKFACWIDNGALLTCTSPFTSQPLAAGAHTFFVAAIDALGNVDQTPASFKFTIVAPATPQGGPPSPVVVSIGSLVLISGKTVHLDKKRVVKVELRCIGTTKKCTGTLALTSANKVKIKRSRRHSKRATKRILKLGAKRFTIAPGKKAKVAMKLSRSKARVVRRLKRFKARATIQQVSASGFPLTSTRTFMLRAR